MASAHLARRNSLGSRAYSSASSSLRQGSCGPCAMVGIALIRGILVHSPFVDALDLVAVVHAFADGPHLHQHALVGFDPATGALEAGPVRRGAHPGIESRRIALALEGAS